MKLLHTLYDEEVLEENMLLQWYHDAIAQPDVDQVHRALYQQVIFARLYNGLCCFMVLLQVEKFMDWLEEAESESGEESE